MVESKKVKETEEEKAKKEIAKNMVEELLTGDGSKRSYNALNAKINGNALRDDYPGEPSNGAKGGCP
jgi:hypothetical protein